MAKGKRRANFTAEAKVAILREHLLEKVPVSEVCERHEIGPSQFYTWQKQLFEQGPKTFERIPSGRERELERKIEKLQARARDRDEVIAEIAGELVRLKKGNGGA